MISVCMGSYNGEKYIREQIESILSQLMPEDELVISDDGSTDNTIDIINSFGDKRIKLITNTGRHGTGPNAVNALVNSKGDAIFLADQDDVWLPGKYEIMINALLGYDFVHHDSIVTDDELNPICESLYNLMHNGPGIIKNMRRGSFYGSHMIITRRLLNLCLPFPDNEEVGHDLWIGFVATMKCRMNYIPDKLIYYRRHGGVHCDLFEPSKRSLPKKIFGRIIMLRYLIGFKLQHKIL